MGEDLGIFCITNNEHYLSLRFYDFYSVFFWGGCNIPDLTDCPHKPTRVFPACFVLTRTVPGKTSQGVTHPRIAPVQARLTLEFPILSYRKEDAPYWYR